MDNHTQVARSLNDEALGARVQRIAMNSRIFSPPERQAFLLEAAVRLKLIGGGARS